MKQIQSPTQQHSLSKYYTKRATPYVPDVTHLGLIPTNRVMLIDWKNLYEKIRPIP